MNAQNRLYQHNTLAMTLGTGSILFGLCDPAHRHIGMHSHLP